MERVLLNKLYKNNKYLIETNEGSGFYLLDCSLDNDFNVVLNSNVSANILLVNIKPESHVHFDVLDNSYLNIKTILKNELKTMKIDVYLSSFAKFEAYCADFSSGNNNVTVDINLDKNGAKAEWHLASLSAKNDNKIFDVSLLHNSLNTIGLSDNYGVSKDDARLVFSGVSTIKKGAKGSKTRQNAKIMVFDEISKAIAKPVLKIDENEIEASHGASVGKINDEHMFYLTSRGLTEEQAKELITLGYLRPILNGFEDEEMKDEISSLIEGRM